MFDRLPAFNPPDTNSAGAIALRAWVRGLTARGPPALAFLRKYEEDDFVSSYDSYLPSGTGSGAKKAYIARALMYALETRLEGTAQVYVDLLIQAKGDISAKGIFLSLIGRRFSALLLREGPARRRQEGAARGPRGERGRRPPHGGLRRRAPPDSCWQAILGFERYAGRLAQCSSSSVYERKKNVMARSEAIKVHMKLAGGVKTFNCFYDHTYRPDKHTVTWTLDPDKKSDFLDVQGQWCVYKHPTKKNWSRVWYSADVVLPPWLPRVVVVQLCKTSGTKALQFAKKEAEAVYKSSSRFAAASGSELAPTPKMAHLR
ncbi:hypothetical protein JL720_15402 [Aureococcus anophagefferens]|nr:hypothetical protein JL720_15402 [Aureococcus anophagefferens]